MKARMPRIPFNPLNVTKFVSCVVRSDKSACVHLNELTVCLC